VLVVSLLDCIKFSFIISVNRFNPRFKSPDAITICHSFDLEALNVGLLLRQEGLNWSKESKVRLSTDAHGSSRYVSFWVCA
jgi:hypothetical protein